MWDGKSSVADFASHLERLKNHAERLRIELPKDLALMIAKAICGLSESVEITQRQILTIRYSNSDNLNLA